MTRILFVVEKRFPSGANRQLFRLASELADIGWEVHVAVLCRPSNLMGAIESSQQMNSGLTANDEIANQHVIFHLLDCTELESPLSRSSLMAAWELRNLLNRLQPDLVHAWCGLTLLITLLACRGRISQHPPRLFASELSLSPAKKIVWQKIEQSLSRHFNKVVVPHRLVAQHLTESGYSTEQIEIIPNAVTDLTFDRQAARQELCLRLGLPTDSILAGTIAPLVDAARLKDLIWACDLLSVIRDDFHLLIFGSGQQWRRFAAIFLAGSVWSAGPFFRRTGRSS